VTTPIDCVNTIEIQVNSRGRVKSMATVWIACVMCRSSSDTAFRDAKLSRAFVTRADARGSILGKNAANRAPRPGSKLALRVLRMEIAQ
jgi:hypothetical protein